MALTREFKETIQARVRADRAFRDALLRDGIEQMLGGDVDAGKAILRDYIKATVGFEQLGAETGRRPRALSECSGRAAIHKRATSSPSSAISSGRRVSIARDRALAVARTSHGTSRSTRQSSSEAAASATSLVSAGLPKRSSKRSARRHRVLVSRLVKSLEPAVVPTNSTVIPKSNGTPTTHRDLVFEITPERTLDSLVLADRLRDQLKEFVEEQHRADLLHSHNLRARNRVLLAGPPGNGKTTLAEALASELMYLLLSVRYETLVGSFLGRNVEPPAAPQSSLPRRSAACSSSTSSRRSAKSAATRTRRARSSALSAHYCCRLTSCPTMWSSWPRAIILNCLTGRCGDASNCGWNCRCQHATSLQTKLKASQDVVQSTLATPPRHLPAPARPQLC